MGTDYAFVHIYFTVPVAVVLLFLLYPLRRTTDLYRLLFLVLIAISFTIPWDSYLLKRGVWSYPAESVIGPTFYRIPLEELFFFFIQTLITSTLYLLLSRPVLMEEYLQPGVKSNGHSHIILSTLGSIVLVTLSAGGFAMAYQQTESMYLGLILMWSCPVLLFLWSITSRFVLYMPARNVIVPIAASTVYLWWVDEMALKKGTWTLNPRFTLDVKLFGALDIEEAIFFLLTNMMVTFGQIACDQALATINPASKVMERSGTSTTHRMIDLLKAACFPMKYCDLQYVQSIQMASVVLQRKSRSFTTASMLFEGKLRIDLLLLYYACRVADDIVDDDSSLEEVEFYLGSIEQWAQGIVKAKEEKFHQNLPKNKNQSGDALESTLSALTKLPSRCCLPKAALLNLLAGFSMDLGFASNSQGIKKEADISPLPKNHDDGTLLANSAILPHNCKHYSQQRSWSFDKFPIVDECCLEIYGYRVAGTVAEMVLSLVFHHYERTEHKSSPAWEPVVRAGARMGIALQYVNIARDVVRDSSDGRVYLPASWLAELGVSNDDILQNPYREEARILRLRLLDMADKIYSENVGAINEIPSALGWSKSSRSLEMIRVRHGMRAAVENYMEIGRMVRKELESGKCVIPKERNGRSKATVPRWRRIWVTAKVLFSS